MMHPNDPARGAELVHLLGAIYYVGDCLSELNATLLPFDGPIDDRIDYAELMVQFIDASGTTVRGMTLLVNLLEQAICDE